LPVFYFCMDKTIGILSTYVFSCLCIHMFFLVFAFRYLKFHYDVDVDALVTELKLLKNIVFCT